MKRNHSKIFHLKEGQSLVEVLVSLAVVITLSVALVSAMLFTQRASRAAKNNTQATKLAQQVLEQLRIYRDRNVLGLDAFPVGPCYTLNDTNPDPRLWVLSACAAPSGGNPQGKAETSDSKVTFYSNIDIVSSSSTKKQVTVKVIWDEVGGRQQIQNTTFFSNCIQQNVTC